MKTPGRILKVKAGYNPNSSSIGTQVASFVVGAAAFSLAANTLVAAIAARRSSREQPKEDTPDLSGREENRQRE